MHAECNSIPYLGAGGFMNLLTLQVILVQNQVLIIRAKRAHSHNGESGLKVALHLIDPAFRLRSFGTSPETSPFKRNKYMGSFQWRPL